MTTTPTERDQSRIDWFRKEAAYWHRQATKIAPTFAHVSDEARERFVAAMLDHERHCLDIAARIEGASHE